MAEDNVESRFAKAFETAIDAVGELMDFAMFFEASVELSGITKQVPKMIAALERGRSEKPAWIEHVSARADDVGRLAESRSDMPSYLYNLCVVRLCSILDTFIDDVVLAALSDRERWERMPKLTSLQVNKVNLVGLLLSSSEQQAHYIVKEIRDSTSANLRMGCGRYEVVLDAIGLGGSIPSTVSAAFLELIETRNIVVHRNGVADKRFLDRCPGHRARVGEKIHIDRTTLSLFAYSAIWYIGELDQRVSRTFLLEHATSQEFSGEILELIEKTHQMRNGSKIATALEE